MKANNGQPQEEFDFYDLDKHRLDEEWVDQVRKFWEGSLRLADARAEWERAKVNLELADAEIDRDIRREPERFGLEKITEPVVERTIILQKKHREAHFRVIDAKHSMDVCTAYVGMLDHRKKALEDLVSLEGRNYFSQPQAKGEDGRKRAEQVREEAAFGGTKKRKVPG